MDTKSRIKLIDLTKNFSNGKMNSDFVLNGITEEFVQGQSYAITGVSGSGKSTLLLLLAGLDKPTSGSVIYRDIDITSLLPHEREKYLQETVGIILQKPHLVKELTVIENVMLKGYALGFPDKKQAEDFLEAVGLADKAYQLPATLSGGQQQRVALARALYGRPEFLIADEPTAHLDSKNKKLILDLIIDLSNRYDMGLIMSTHDVEVAMSMEHTLELQGGKLHKVYPDKILPGVSVRSL